MINHNISDSQSVFGDDSVLDEDYLRESNVLNLLPAAVYVCNLSGHIVSYNQKAVELWGRTPVKGDDDERFCGAFKLYYPDGTYMPHNETPVAACLVDGLPRKALEVVIERPDLSRVIARVNVTPIKNKEGQLVGMVNYFEDITEQRAAQEELQRKTTELQDYVDNASIGLHWVDSSGIIKWANKAELDILGYTPDEYIGHYISEFHVDQEKINDILHRLSCKETLNGYESTLRCKDGTTKIVHINSNVYFEDGKFIHTRCFTIDVTEQKRLYQSLKSSEQRYRELVNSLPAGLYACDKDGRITFFNEQAVTLWGYRPMINDNLKFCACYKVWTMDGTFINPDQTPMSIALKTGQSFRNVEALVERPDGSKFYADVNIDPMRDEFNNIIGAINIFQDISNIKETEAALKESEAQYKNLIHTLNTPLYTTDPEGRITLYNKAAADLWGREPVIGKDLWCGSYKIFTKEGRDLPLENCPMAVCLKEHRPVYGEEILVVRPDGKIRNVAPHPQPILDSHGKMVGAINMLIDVTELKEKEKALKESEQKYRELAGQLEKKVEEKTNDLVLKNEELRKSEERYHQMVDEVEDYAIILLDINGNILNWNKGAEKIKGYKEDEIIGKNLEVFYLDKDRAINLPGKLINEAKNNGKTAIEGWRVRKDGTQFYGSIVITAIHDKSGNIIGFTKVTRDLTEKKLAEDKLKEYSNKLEFQNKELEQFAYAASHDMKEPLRKIYIYSSFVKDNPSNKLDNKSQDYLTRSLDAVNRMKALIENLLAYSRTALNAENLVEIDFNTIVDEIVLEHKEELEQENIKLEVSDLPIIKVVPFQCKQLMYNLIQNSIKYRQPDKASIIKIDYQFIESDESTRARPGKYHRISVTDNGIGFDSKYSEKIFELFQRLSAGTKGSGIGLAICKKIVQNHKGYITAEGKPNEGARFDIYLPASY
ncbi:MAG TPA: PAS domain S-box protein [Cytophagales bacterium]|nr:PAS domain S-box protein [Cytophagales bacterium]